MQCLVKRYQNFKDDISEHLDNILERRQQIDTSFIQINDEFISDRKVVKEYFLNYYRELFASCVTESPDSEDEFSSEKVQIMQEITIDEFMLALNSLPRNKACGVSGVKVEMLQLSSYRIHDWLLDWFNGWIRMRELPRCILQSQIWLIPKGTYDGNPMNTRPINLIEIPRKLFAIILVKRLAPAIERKNLFKSINFGFRVDMSTIDPIKTLQVVIEHSKIYVE